MSHTVRDHDGMKVLVVTDLAHRTDEDGKVTSTKPVDNLEIVHASEIAKYYRIPLRSVGQGDNEVHGVWNMVHSNEIGQRVPYNSEASRRGDRNVRVQRPDPARPGEIKEEIKRYTVHHTASGEKERGNLPLVEETDDGMYVKLADILEYAEAQGWRKDGGRPGLAPTKAHVEDTNAKLDKLADLVAGLATIVAQQVVVHPAKGAK